MAGATDACCALWNFHAVSFTMFIFLIGVIDPVSSKTLHVSMGPYFMHPCADIL